MTNKKAIGKAISSSKEVKKTSKPKVTVKTKKLSNDAEMSSCGSVCSERKTFAIYLVILILIVLNVGSTIFLYFNSPAKRLEMIKVWGRENYEKTLQIYKSNGFAQQQKQYLEGVLEQMNNVE